MFWKKLNPRALEGIREMGAALAAIFVHSVIVHSFEQKDLSWLSFMGALVAAGGMWWFLDWRFKSWLEEREVWLAEEARTSSIEGSWGSIVKFGDTDELKISLINIQRTGNKIDVNGITLKWQPGTAPNGPLSNDGQWHSKEAAYSDSTSTLIYAFDSHTNLESGMCVYTFQRPDSQSAPTAYTGYFIERGKPEVFRVTAKRISSALKLDDMPSIKAAAKKLYRSLGDQKVPSSAAKSSPTA